jgi:hypothetical protein
MADATNLAFSGSDIAILVTSGLSLLVNLILGIKVYKCQLSCCRGGFILNSIMDNQEPPTHDAENPPSTPVTPRETRVNSENQ